MCNKNTHRLSETHGLNSSSLQHLCVFLPSQIYYNRFGCMFAFMPSVPATSALQPRTCHAGFTVLSQISENNALLSLTVGSQNRWSDRPQWVTCRAPHTRRCVCGIWFESGVSGRQWILTRWGYVKPGFAFTGRWSVRKIKLLALCAAEVGFA